uniref:WAP domain-containing protein n=1 Tax=Nothobranchius furzeri TaxID=105023 RepID=A0A8C6LYU7_NOTFU
MQPQTTILLLSLSDFFCPNTCLEGNLEPTQSKPGECPAMFYTFLPAHKCHCDSDCPGKEKCCTYYHNSVCAPPVSTIPRCPMIRGVRVICIEQCSGNWDCKHHEICCFNGCGHVCMSPNRGEFLLNPHFTPVVSVLDSK